MLVFGVLCVCVCACVCVFSVCVCLVCVCVCVCISISLRYANRTNTIHANTICVNHASQKRNPRFTTKSTPNTISLSYSTIMLFCPTNPHTAKTTFDFPLRNSEFYFLFSVAPHRFLFSVCPVTKPP